jgi:hydrogenase-4 component F
VIILLIVLPAIAGATAFLVRRDPARRGLLVGAAIAHAALTASCWWRRAAPLASGWLALDAAGLLFLSLTSLLFLASAVYAVDYLRHEVRGGRTDFVEGSLFSNAPEAVFTACLLFFLATMTLVCASRHFGLLWVAVEATTLASAPLIYFHRHHRSLEATWKYLVICSVGIGLALLGTLCLAVAAAGRGGGAASMVLDDLLARGGSLEPSWLRLAFLLLLVGYGTKMGLAPLHTWLPDAHSESPSLVSALLSGALLNCAFLAILRSQQVLEAGGQGGVGRDLLLTFGLASMGLAGVFVLGQTDYKRMLAYSSVEHMGILALGVGLGGAAARGAMLHAVNHSLTKGVLFLVAGNILHVYQTKGVASVTGLVRTLPISGPLWVAGMLAVTGSPPFGPFLSEFIILVGALQQGRGVVAVLYLVFLATVFVGMGQTVLRMAQGPAPPGGPAPGTGEPWPSVIVPAALAAAVLVLGVYVPPALDTMIREAASLVGGS